MKGGKWGRVTVGSGVGDLGGGVYPYLSLSLKMQMFPMFKENKSISYYVACDTIPTMLKRVRRNDSVPSVSTV